MSPEIAGQIITRLYEIERLEAVRIPLAVESGSRAWGFPSPDSDYDCRFVYVRRRQDISVLFPKRDVIETPLTPVFDINGWDLAKAIKLLLKGNAVILEWLQSPISYIKDVQFSTLLLQLAERVYDRRAAQHHYYHLLLRQQERHVAGSPEVPLKKLFYLLRPAMALAYLRECPNVALAPMNFQKLCEGVNLRPDFRDILSRLLAQKAVTRELGSAVSPSAVTEFVRAEIECAANLGPRPQLQKHHVAEAEKTYQTLIEKYAP